MIRFYKTLHPATLFLIPLITLLLWIPGFFKENFVVTEYHGVLSAAVLGIIKIFPRFLQVILAVLLISFEGIYLSLIVNRHEVLFKNSHLPALMYVVLMSFNADVITFNEILLVNLILVITCDKLFSLFKKDNPVSTIFDCGLLLSIASLIYFPCVFLLLFFLIALIIQRPFSFREWSIALVSFVLPYFFLLVYLFLTGPINGIFEKLVPSQLLSGSFTEFRWSLSSSQKNSSVLLFASFLLIMLVLSLFRLRSNYYKNTIKTRSAQQVLIILSLFVFTELILLRIINISYVVQLAIPFSIFLAYYYVTGQRRLWLFEASFWIFVGLIVQGYF